MHAMPNLILMTVFFFLKTYMTLFLEHHEERPFSNFRVFFLKIHIFRFFTGIAKSGQITLFFTLYRLFVCVFLLSTSLRLRSSFKRTNLVTWCIFWKVHSLWKKLSSSARSLHHTSYTVKNQVQTDREDKSRKWLKKLQQTKKKIQERGKTVVKEPNCFKSKSYVKSERLEYVIVWRGNLFWKEWLWKIANFNNMLNFRWDTTHNLEFQSWTGRNWNFSKFV